LAGLDTCGDKEAGCACTGQLSLVDRHWRPRYPRRQYSCAEVAWRSFDRAWSRHDRVLQRSNRAPAQIDLSALRWAPDCVFPASTLGGTGGVSRRGTQDSAVNCCSGLAVIVALLPLPVLAAEAAGCLPPQQTLFSCSTGNKSVSICGSPNLSAGSGSLQYRFGSPARLELSYPPTDADWRQFTRAGTLMFSGGGGAFLAFENTPFRYVVYTAAGRGWGSKAGVIVEKNRKRIASLACKGEVMSRLGPDLYSTAGIAESDENFELP
jgi:hypothetical protein